MKRHTIPQEIHEMLDRFMDGISTLQDERQLAEYFCTHEVDDEWREYKEMFELFDQGEVAPAPLKPRLRLVRLWPLAAAACVAGLIAIFLTPPKAVTPTGPLEPAVAQGPTDTTAHAKDTVIILTNPDPLPVHLAEAPAKPKPKAKLQTDAPKAEPLEIPIPDQPGMTYTISNSERLKYTPEELKRLKERAQEKYQEWLQLEQEIMEHELSEVAELIQ